MGLGIIILVVLLVLSVLYIKFKTPSNNPVIIPPAVIISPPVATPSVDTPPLNLNTSNFANISKSNFGDAPGNGAGQPGIMEIPTKIELTKIIPTEDLVRNIPTDNTRIPMDDEISKKREIENVNCKRNIDAFGNRVLSVGASAVLGRITSVNARTQADLSNAHDKLKRDLDILDNMTPEKYASISVDDSISKRIMNPNGSEPSDKQKKFYKNTLAPLISKISNISASGLYPDRDALMDKTTALTSGEIGDILNSLSAAEYSDLAQSLISIIFMYDNKLTENIALLNPIAKQKMLDLYSLIFNININNLMVPLGIGWDQITIPDTSITSTTPLGTVILTYTPRQQLIKCVAVSLTGSDNGTSNVPMLNFNISGTDTTGVAITPSVSTTGLSAKYDRASGNKIIYVLPLVYPVFISSFNLSVTGNGSSANITHGLVLFSYK